MKKQQILFIHWWECFNSYDRYLDFLENTMDANPFYEKTKRWKDDISEKLWEEFEFIQPSMPWKYNAQYSEWKIWFEKTLNFLDEEIILAGWSLGWTFLVKYLWENNINKKIKALFLIAPAFNEEMEDLWDFKFEINVKNIEKQVKDIYLYHCLDDNIVPFSNFLEFKKSFTKPICKTFEEWWHFLWEEFSELIKDIKSMIIKKDI